MREKLNKAKYELWYEFLKRSTLYKNVCKLYKIALVFNKNFGDDVYGLNNGAIVVLRDKVHHFISVPEDQGSIPNEIEYYIKDKSILFDSEEERKKLEYAIDHVWPHFLDVFDYPFDCFWANIKKNYQSEDFDYINVIDALKTDNTNPSYIENMIDNCIGLHEFIHDSEPNCNELKQLILNEFTKQDKVKYLRVSLENTNKKILTEQFHDILKENKKLLSGSKKEKQRNPYDIKIKVNIAEIERYLKAYDMKQKS